MSKLDESCGAELAAGADIPEEFGRLFAHVAKNLRAHAIWVGEETTAYKREHDALAEAADAYESISDACARTAELLHSFATLPLAPHDVTKWDRPAWADRMRTKINFSVPWRRAWLNTRTSLNKPWQDIPKVSESSRGQRVLRAAPQLSTYRIDRNRIAASLPEWFQSLSFLRAREKTFENAHSRLFES